MVSTKVDQVKDFGVEVSIAYEIENSTFGRNEWNKLTKKLSLKRCKSRTLSRKLLLIQRKKQLRMLIIQNLSLRKQWSERSVRHQEGLKRSYSTSRVWWSVRHLESWHSKCWCRLWHCSMLGNSREWKSSRML